MLISWIYEKFYGIEIIKYYLIEIGKYEKSFGDAMALHEAILVVKFKLR